MKTVRRKTLKSIEPYTKYEGCTFYLNGEHCLDECAFENCSFRGDFHYVEYPLYKDFPSFKDCGFNCGEIKVTMLNIQTGLFHLLKSMPIKRLKIKPRYKDDFFVCDGLRSETLRELDLSEIPAFTKWPVDLFDKIPSLYRLLIHPKTELSSKDIYEIFDKGLHFREKKSGKGKHIIYKVLTRKLPPAP